MPGFDHHAAPPEPADPATQARNARYGLALFFLYLAVYTGFVLLNAFAPTLMATPLVGGVNLAVLYGLGLIAAALALALLYAWLCRRPAGPKGGAR
jgi:uncharacterized membrane protein (DUF485 family)